MTLEPEDYLQPDESVLLAERPRLAAAAAGSVVTFLLAGAAVAALWFAQDRWLAEWRPWLLAVGGSVVAILWASGVAVALLRLRTSRYVVTDQRLYRSHGRIRFHLVQTTYDKVTDLQVTQGPLGRALGYGSLTASTAGAALALPGVPRPFEAKRRLEEARSAFLQTLVRQRAPAAARAARGGAEGAEGAQGAGKVGPSGADLVAEGATVWSGSPALASLLGRLATATLLILGGLLLALLGSGGRWGFFGPGGFAILFGLLSASSAFIAYRFSRFEVTTHGVVVSTGWLSRRRVETTFAKVTDVTTTQTLLGRLLGYGDIRVNTAGSNDVPVAFAGVARPEEVKGLIDQARRERA